MRDKSGREIDDLQIGKLMEQFGFNSSAPTSTARALILNLVRSAYGPEAAREFMRQMNLEKNRDVEPHVVMSEFKATLMKIKTQIEIPGVGSEETQLSLFDASPDFEASHAGDDIPSGLQKRIRRA